MAVFFGSSKSTEAQRIRNQVRKGTLRQLSRSLYTDDLQTPAETVVRQYLFTILAHFHPNAVISHRSAIEGAPSSAGNFHITLGKSIRTADLPGLRIRIWPGVGAQPTDTPVGPGLFMASRPRALLENLQRSRARAGEERKNVSRETIEEWIETQVRIHSWTTIDRIVAEARTLAPTLGLTSELEELESVVAAMRGTSSRPLSSPLARARASGQPYDPDRVALFRSLAVRLTRETFREVPPPPVEETTTRAFWEAYFSNFIEGTIFTVEEARRIVFDHILSSRPKDAHDVSASYRLILDPVDNRNTGGNAESFVNEIKIRHARLMAERPEIAPGNFKREANQVGGRVFVRPELVDATLRHGWEIGTGLPDPVARALFIGFVVAETHPFNDGNGRIARLCMNAELSSAGRMRWIVPTSLRTDYLSCLEALTNSGNADPWTRFGHRMIEITSAVPAGDGLAATEAYFRRTGGLEERKGNFGADLLNQ